jgi:ADP-ribose pyrophosphatase
VHESVLANDAEKVPGGWADPEDFDAVAAMSRFGGVRNRDDRERPLNPRGRTGLAGRGLLGRWGPNQAATAVVLRVSDDHQHADVLLGAREQDGKLWLPKGFVQENEDYSTAIDRILQSETGWCPGVRDDHVVHEGYFYDPRQTDHAWVEIRAGLAVVEFDDAPREFVPGGDFETVRWMPVDADTVNRMPSAEARFVQQALRHLQQDGTIGDATAQQVLSRSG